MDVGAILTALGMGFIQLLAGLVLAMVSIYLGVSLFGRFTKGIDEEAEVNKGNAAVGILLAAIILAIATVVQSGVSGMTSGLIGGAGGGWQAIVGGFIQMIFGLIFAVIAIYMALSIWDRITKNVDETEELKKGNVAVGVVMAGVLLAVAFVINSAVGGMSSAMTQALMNLNNMGSVLMALLMGFLQLIVGLVLAMVSIYMGVSLFGRFTKGIDEEVELNKGNLAVGILLAAIILAIATVVQSGVTGMTGGIIGGAGGWQAVVGGFIQVILGLIFAVVAIYMALNIWDRITKNIEETEELKKGNAAVGIVMAGVLLAVAFVINSAVGGMSIAITSALMHI